MKNIIDHTIISSFKEFLSYKLQGELEAYTNKTVPLYKYTPNRRFIGKDTYGAPYAQWIYDSSVTGSQIPTGVSGLNRGQSGLSIDFKNGRVLVNSGVPITGTVDVSIPDFNIYITTTSIQQILLENKYEYAPDLAAANQPIKPDSIIAPCIFISYDNTTNNPWALGGLDETKFLVQVAVFADNPYKLLGVQKVIRDITQKLFPIVPFTPLNELNDLKFNVWDYEMLLDNVTDPDTFIYVDKTTFRILDLDYINQEHPNILVGLGTVSLAKYRQPSSDDVFTFPEVYVDNDGTYYLFNDGYLALYNPGDGVLPIDPDEEYAAYVDENEVYYIFDNGDIALYNLNEEEYYVYTDNTEGYYYEFSDGYLAEYNIEYYFDGTSYYTFYNDYLTESS